MGYNDCSFDSVSPRFIERVSMCLSLVPRPSTQLRWTEISDPRIGDVRYKAIHQDGYQNVFYSLLFISLNYVNVEHYLSIQGRKTKYFYSFFF